MSDERRASVCGDPVESAVADEPSVSGDDLHPHETSVEDHEGDEGPEAGPAPDADPTATILPGVPDVNEKYEERIKNASTSAPIAVVCRRKRSESFIDINFKCPDCKLPVAAQIKFSSNDEPVNYHIISEQQATDCDNDCVDQVFASCVNAPNDVMETFILSLMKKYSELIK